MSKIEEYNVRVREGVDTTTPPNKESIKEKIPMINSKKGSVRWAGYIMYALLALFLPGTIFPNNSTHTISTSTTTAAAYHQDQVV